MSTREKLSEALAALAFVQSTIDSEVMCGRAPRASLFAEKRRVRSVVDWYERALLDEEARSANGR